MPRKPSESAARHDKAAPAPRARAAAKVGTELSIPSQESVSPKPMPTARAGALKEAPSSQERIAMRAYLKWLERGCPPGDGKRDWFEAEEELRRETEPA